MGPHVSTLDLLIATPNASLNSIGAMASSCLKPLLTLNFDDKGLPVLTLAYISLFKILHKLTTFLFWETYFMHFRGTAVAQWLRCCATNRKVAGSIPAGVSGFFIDIKSFRSHYGPGVDSASNIN